MKTCRRCNVTKPIDSFATKRNYCRPCYSAVRGREYGVRGRRKGTTVVDEQILDLLSISCEWWTVEGLMGRLDRSRKSVEHHLEAMYGSGRLRRRYRLQTGAYEYQADPFWIGGSDSSHPSVMVPLDREGEAA